MALILSGDTGPSFVQAAAQPAGCVLQVVNATYSTQTTNGSSTYIDTGLTATITPRASTSKILILVNQADCYNGYTNGSLIGIRLVKGATTLVQFSTYSGYVTGGSWGADIGSCSTSYLDSPATTSPVTYKTQFNSTNNTGGMSVQYNSGTSTISLIEIAG